MKLSIPILILCLLGCSSAPGERVKEPSKMKPQMMEKPTAFAPKTIESARAAAKKEDFCYYKENKRSKRCRFTLLSSEAEKTYLIYTKALVSRADKDCRDRQEIKIPRDEKTYMRTREREDGIARVANLAVKKGANLISMRESQARFVSAVVYDCSSKILGQMLGRLSLNFKGDSHSEVKL